MDRGLTTIKVIVVVLGLLIIAATVALVMFAFNQPGKQADTTTSPPAAEMTVPAATDAPAANDFADVAVALPAGARVVSMIGEGGVLTLLVQTPDGAQSIVTLDRRSGEVLGTLELVPRAAGSN